MADTAVVGAATLLSRILGFLRNAVVSAFFGQGWKADVLNTVFNIPMNLRKLVAEGALSTAFIPVLSQSLVDDPTRVRARQLVRAIFSLQIVVLLPLTVLSIVFAPQIIALLAPFGGIAEKQDLAVNLFRWFIGFLFLVSWSAVMMAVENTHRQFVIPAVSPLLFSLAVIVSLFLWAPTWGVYAQVPGVLVGGLLPILLQWIPLRKLGYSMKPLLHFQIPELKQTLKKWVPALMTSGIALLNQQISMTLATVLHEGSASALSNAIVFWQLPAGVLSASVITVFFPRMSRLNAGGDHLGAKRALFQGLELQALLLIPASVLLTLFSEPVIALAFQRGLYTYQDSQLAARVLSWLSGGLFFAGIFSFLQRYFYSRGNFRTPFLVSLVWAASDVVISVIMMQTSWGVVGLALGSVVGYVVGAIILLILIAQKESDVPLGHFVWFVIRVGLACLPLVWGYLSLSPEIGNWWSRGMTLTSVFLFLAEGCGALVLLTVGLLAVGIFPWRYLRTKGSQK